MHFDCVIVFEVLKSRTSHKGGAHAQDTWTPDKSTVCMSTTLNEISVAVFDNVVEICNRIMFDFHQGLPHMYM